MNEMYYLDEIVCWWAFCVWSLCSLCSPIAARTQKYAANKIRITTTKTRKIVTLDRKFVIFIYTYIYVCKSFIVGPVRKLIMILQYNPDYSITDYPKTWRYPK